MNNFENNTFVTAVHNHRLLERRNTTWEAVQDLLSKVEKGSYEYETMKDLWRFSTEEYIVDQVEEFNYYMRGKNLHHLLLAVTHIP